jgi:hypothetical protein
LKLCRDFSDFAPWCGTMRDDAPSLVDMSLHSVSGSRSRRIAHERTHSRRSSVPSRRGRGVRFLRRDCRCPWICSDRKFCKRALTAAVFINDNESGLFHDYEVWLENSPRMLPLRSITTTEPARTMQTRISSGKSRAVKWWSLSPTAKWTSDHGSKSSTASSTGIDGSVCS